MMKIAVGSTLSSLAHEQPDRQNQEIIEQNIFKGGDSKAIVSTANL